MGIINMLTKRCIFCKSREGTEYVPDYGIYGEESGNWYHKECLNEIACDPEKYPSRLVDMAVEMIERIKEYKKRTAEAEEREKQRIKQNIEFLKSHCV